MCCIQKFEGQNRLVPAHIRPARKLKPYWRYGTSWRKIVAIRTRFHKVRCTLTALSRWFESYVVERSQWIVGEDFSNFPLFYYLRFPKKCCFSIFANPKLSEYSFSSTGIQGTSMGVRKWAIWHANPVQVAGCYFFKCFAKRHASFKPFESNTDEINYEK